MSCVQFKFINRTHVIGLVIFKIRDSSNKISSFLIFNLASPTLGLEVLFLLDGSGTVGLSNYEKVKDWVKNISKKLGLNEGRVQVGVVQYSHYYA